MVISTTLFVFRSVLMASAVLFAVSYLSVAEFAIDGTVLELDESNFDSAISSFDFVLVDFYAPWCGHCKRLSPELDKAAPVLAGLKVPVVIAKVNADKYRKFASKFEIDGYPTLKVFMHGIPIDYTGPRKAELLVRFLRKFTARDVSILEQDSGVKEFVESAGVDFPVFVGFGLNESLILGLGKKYRNRAWFSVARDFSEDLMIKYDFDKVPALVHFHPKYNEHSVFYGPFEGSFLEDFVQQNLLPLAVPISYETLKLLSEDERKILLTFVDDEFSEGALKLIKTLKAAASANRDLVFAYAGMKQWNEFGYTFGIKDTTKLPKAVIWNGLEEYYVSEDLESLDDGEDQFSQLSRFLQAYKDGKLVQKGLSKPSPMDFLTQRTTIYMIVFAVLVFILLLYLTMSIPDTNPAPRDIIQGNSAAESEEEYHRNDKED